MIEYRKTIMSKKISLKKLELYFRVTSGKVPISASLAYELFLITVLVLKSINKENVFSVSIIKTITRYSVIACKISTGRLL